MFFGCLLGMFATGNFTVTIFFQPHEGRVDASDDFPEFNWVIL